MNTASLGHLSVSFGILGIAQDRLCDSIPERKASKQLYVNIYCTSSLRILSRL